MSQEARILDYLKKGNKITPLEALNLFGSMRLAAIVEKLRRQGIPIEGEMIANKNGKKFKQYWLSQGKVETKRTETSRERSTPEPELFQVKHNQHGFSI